MFAFNISKIAQLNGGKYALADKIGVTYESVRRWCLGENLPDGQTLLVMRDMFHVSIDWLLTGKTPSGGKCPFCGDLPKHTQEALLKLKDIFESKDEVIVPALQANLAAFHDSIGRGVKVKALESNVEILNREVQHLKKLIDPAKPLTGTD